MRMSLLIILFSIVLFGFFAILCLILFNGKALDEQKRKNYENIIQEIEQNIAKLEAEIQENQNNDTNDDTKIKGDINELTARLQQCYCGKKTNCKMKKNHSTWCPKLKK